jgi:hypothetical protein
MDELRVAVIDDVEEIEAIGEARDDPRIVPQTVRDAIGAPHPRRLPGAWQSPGAAVHRRPDERRRDRGRMLALETIEEHVGDKIHARPPLFEVVGDDGDT